MRVDKQNPQYQTPTANYIIGKQSRHNSNLNGFDGSVFQNNK